MYVEPEATTVMSADASDTDISLLTFMQGFSAADLPQVELTSSRGGRSSLFRASAARFFDLRSQVCGPFLSSSQLPLAYTCLCSVATTRHVSGMASLGSEVLCCFSTVLFCFKALKVLSMTLPCQYQKPPV